MARRPLESAASATSSVVPSALWSTVSARLLSCLSSLLLASCSLPPTIEPHPRRIQWEQEPAVGTDEAGLQELTRKAVVQWGVGSYVMGCSAADICVRVAPLESDRWGYAEWPSSPERCSAWVMGPYPEIVVPHEVGHCLGLAHSHDRRSVMYPTVPAYPRDEEPNWMQYVTPGDRRAVRALFP